MAVPLVSVRQDYAKILLPRGSLEVVSIKIRLGTGAAEVNTYSSLKI